VRGPDGRRFSANAEGSGAGRGARRVGRRRVNERRDGEGDTRTFGPGLARHVLTRQGRRDRHRMRGVLLEEAIGTAKAGDAPVLVEARREARADQRSGQQQHDGPADEAHGRDDTGRGPAGGQAIGLGYTRSPVIGTTGKRGWRRRAISVTLPTRHRVSSECRQTRAIDTVLSTQSVKVELSVAANSPQCDYKNDKGYAGILRSLQRKIASSSCYRRLASELFNSSTPSLLHPRSTDRQIGRRRRRGISCQGAIRSGKTAESKFRCRRIAREKAHPRTARGEDTIDGSVHLNSVDEHGNDRADHVCLEDVAIMEVPVWAFIR
jgi:hypothetical protein